MGYSFWSAWAVPATFVLLANLYATRLLIIQLRMTQALSRSEFIHRINENLERYRKLRTYLRTESGYEGAEEDLRTESRDYMVIFEGVHCLLEDKILTEGEVRKYFGARFREYSSHQTTQNFFKWNTDFDDMRDAFDALKRIVNNPQRTQTRSPRVLGRTDKKDRIVA